MTETAGRESVLTMAGAVPVWGANNGVTVQASSVEDLPDQCRDLLNIVRDDQQFM